MTPDAPWSRPLLNAVLAQDAKHPGNTRRTREAVARGGSGTLESRYPTPKRESVIRTLCMVELRYEFVVHRVGRKRVLRYYGVRPFNVVDSRRGVSAVARG